MCALCTDGKIHQLHISTGNEMRRFRSCEFNYRWLVCLTNPSCYALMSDMEIKASLMRDTGIDMRFVGLTRT
jgi:hypothetical protein